MQHYTNYSFGFHVVAWAIQHCNNLISLSLCPSFCYGLWFLLVSPDRMCSTAHLPHSFYSVNVAHVLSEGQRMEDSASLFWTFTTVALLMMTASSRYLNSSYHSGHLKMIEGIWL